MLKENKYNWKDSNVELIGSKEDRETRKNAAEEESAWRKAKACEHPQLFIWRVEKFQVVEWPKEQHGIFYEGDSYIILNIYLRDESQLLYDLHFWIGKYSTQDEYGTAVYKTVELDTLLDDKAVQHREVQNYESDLFKSYFQNLVYLKGGCESGFRVVNPLTYRPRLLHFKGRRRDIVVTEISATAKNINSEDVFIFDTGTELFQWNGKGANKDEKFKAQQFAQQLNSDRNGKCRIEVIDEEDRNSNIDFHNRLSDSDPEDDEKKISALQVKQKQIYRMSDSSGSMEFELVGDGEFNKSVIDENDVFIIDNGQIIYVYVGESSSEKEKKNALIYAHMYLKVTGYPQAPVTVISKNVDEYHTNRFNKIFQS